jgi:hypothetical protein
MCRELVVLALTNYISVFFLFCHASLHFSVGRLTMKTRKPAVTTKTRRMKRTRRGTPTQQSLRRPAAAAPFGLISTALVRRGRGVPGGDLLR